MKAFWVISTRSNSSSRLAKVSNGHLMLVALGFLLAIAFSALSLRIFSPQVLVPQLLTDPFLQLPTANSVRVVWFTEFAGVQHVVEYGDRFAQRVPAQTMRLSRMRQEQKLPPSEQFPKGQLQPPVDREIWRHEAEITGLSPNVRLPYRVMSESDQGRTITSPSYTLSALPTTGTPLKILLTSDHQLKPMTPANLQKVVETVGQVDAVFFAGDLVDVADRAAEWFDDTQGNAFFPSLQGRASYEIEHNGVKTRYTGGAIIQSAPLFPAVGNHEVMGRFSLTASLDEQFNDPIPRQVAEQFYTQNAPAVNPGNDLAMQSTWIKNNSFNTDSYEELFTLPTESPGGKRYYAVTIGDVRLIVLYATNIWRRPSLKPEIRGRYREREADLNFPERWGYGQHIFEPITPGSPQYTWLQAELARPEFQQAKYRVVMFHHPPHCVGDNIVPAYTDPVQIIERAADGSITAVRYEYPLGADYLIRDVMPLLEAAGVQLVFYGHSHIWNRFVSPTGMHFLESSNVGNTYGAYMGEKRRPVPENYAEQYVAIGDPNGLQPIVPTVAPLLDSAQQPQPYIASNEITAFSILDTGTGTINSYRFDTRQPDSAAILFDQFTLLK